MAIADNAVLSAFSAIAGLLVSFYKTAAGNNIGQFKPLALKLCSVKFVCDNEYRPILQ